MLYYIILCQYTNRVRLGDDNISLVMDDVMLRFYYFFFSVRYWQVDMYFFRHTPHDGVRDEHAAMMRLFDVESLFNRVIYRYRCCEITSWSWPLKISTIKRWSECGTPSPAHPTFVVVIKY